jgi:hypothetical protein
MKFTSDYGQMSMQLQEWIEVTRKVLIRDGADGFQPTLADPRSQQVRALQGIPKSVEPTRAIQEWAAQLRVDEFFFAVAESADVIVVGWISPVRSEFAELGKQIFGWKDAPRRKPSWWRYPNL